MSSTLAPQMMTPIDGEQNKRVCYFFDSDIGGFHYGPGHPMKPTRIRMCHALVMNYGLYKKMEIFRAKPATKREMSQFHSDEYVDFLNRINPGNMNSYAREQLRYNVGDDCPVFDGLFDYCSISAGGSMEGAARLSRNKCDIAINWAGGLHHAKKSEASGFCYVNDIVLGILELLRYHHRVLYIDIDVHHGDGVEEAFYTTDRVMTCSFHQYGEFFPGTGDLRDSGIGKGKNYALNFPLRSGITDENYKSVFEPVIREVMHTYAPGAIVLQCGTDSLSGDKLGCLNLSMGGHANCVQFVKSFGTPLLLLGGGGYTMRNVSRAWAYETGLAAGVKLGKKIPLNEYYEYFGPTYELDVRSSNMDDLNSREYLDRVRRITLENLRATGGPPSVQLQPTPRLPRDDEDENMDEDKEDPNERRTQNMRDKNIQRPDELSDSEDEGEGGRKHRQDRKKRTSPPASSSRRPPRPADGESDDEEWASSTKNSALADARKILKSPPRVMSAGEGADGGAGRVGIMDGMDIDMDVDDDAEAGEVRSGEVAVMQQQEQPQIADGAAATTTTDDGSTVIEKEVLVNEDTEMGVAEAAPAPAAPETAASAVVDGAPTSSAPAPADLGEQNYPGVPEGAVPHLNMDAPPSSAREEK